MQKKAFLAFFLTLAAFAAGIGARLYDLLATGFILPDEVRYVFDFAHGTVYSNEYAFSFLNIGLFRALHITNLDTFLHFMPFYLLGIGALSILALDLLLEELDLDRHSVLLFLCALPVVVLDLGFLPDGLGLMFCLFGLWALFRSRKDWRLAPVSGALIALAAFAHQPYVVMLGFAGLAAVKSWRRFVAYYATAAPAGAWYSLTMFGRLQLPVRSETVGLPTSIPCTSACMTASPALSVLHFVAVSFVSGWGILLVPASVGAYLALRQRRYELLAVAAAGVLTVVGTAIWEASVANYYWNPFLVSALFRYSGPSMPALLLLSAVALRSLKAKRTAIALCFIGSLLVGTAALPLLSSQVAPDMQQSPAIALRDYAWAHPSQLVCATGVTEYSTFPLTPLFVPYTWQWTPLTSYVSNVRFAASAEGCPPSGSHLWNWTGGAP